MIPRENGSFRSPGIESDGIHETEVTDRSIRIRGVPLVCADTLESGQSPLPDMARPVERSSPSGREQRPVQAPVATPVEKVEDPEGRGQPIQGLLLLRRR